MIHFHTLKVKSVEKSTPTSVVVTFDIPADLKDTFKFTPGQHITIKKELNSVELRRSYSICSSTDKESISIGIKAIEDGTFSKYAQSIQVGDSFEVYPPEGHFTYQPEKLKDQNIAAFAAGSGITPIMSIMKEVLQNTNSKFLLVFGNKTMTETMFHKQISGLLEQYPGRLIVQFIYSQKEEDNALFGRIEKSSINFMLRNKCQDIPFGAFYLCGPEEMTENVTKVLLENEIPKELIKTELFTTSDDEDHIAESIEGQTKVTVMVDEEESSFVMDRKKRVLDAVLEEDIDAPYSCQGGICSSCVARLKEGKVEMVKNQILTDSEIQEGLILTCQAHPTTPTISIDYDDV
ncbi:2Fe-2S iron-sulfur cluster-binding protein [Galbibacter sp.]|jgi:ring-1,2-phenylacetyl-CoA epoxidase subunit PaaE|uniref:2Fe-2S iron-sulfur cluster-binding protein n=1 Tax=Galbibacter sp. TaxID=2918471 RepID=UPI003A90EC35